jgi:hypothetical protein
MQPRRCAVVARRAPFAIKRRHFKRFPVEKEEPMADHAAEGAVEMGGVVEYEDHHQTYESFLKVTKWMVIFLVILLIFLFKFVF